MGDCNDGGSRKVYTPTGKREEKQHKNLERLSLGGPLAGGAFVGGPLVGGPLAGGAFEGAALALRHLVIEHKKITRYGVGRPEHNNRVPHGSCTN